MKKLFNVALGAAIVAGALLLTTANVGKASADDGTTTLSGAACGTPASVQAYSIDFGTYLASDVYSSIKYNAGTKGVGGAGIQRTPNVGSGGADYYAYVTNPCARTGWVVQVDASSMTSMTPGAPTIADTASTFSGAAGYFLFNSSPANPTVTHTAYPSTTDLSSARTVLTHGGTQNGIAGDYGVLLTHVLAIPVATPAALYTGTYSVTCVGC